MRHHAAHGGIADRAYLSWRAWIAESGSKPRNRSWNARLWSGCFRWQSSCRTTCLTRLGAKNRSLAFKLTPPLHEQLPHRVFGKPTLNVFHCSPVRAAQLSNSERKKGLATPHSHFRKHATATQESWGTFTTSPALPHRAPHPPTTTRNDSPVATRVTESGTSTFPSVMISPSNLETCREIHPSWRESTSGTTDSDTPFGSTTSSRPETTRRDTRLARWLRRTM